MCRGRTGIHAVCGSDTLCSFDHDGHSWLRRCVSSTRAKLLPRSHRTNLTKVVATKIPTHSVSACMLHSTGLVVGPKKQLKSMTKPDRIGCVVGFVFFFTMTIVTTFSSKANFIVVLFFACGQLAAYIYYILSYIPFGRKGAQKLVKTAFVRLAPALLHRLSSCSF